MANRNKNQIFYNNIRSNADIGVVPYTILHGLPVRKAAPTNGQTLSRERLSLSLQHVRNLRKAK